MRRPLVGNAMQRQTARPATLDKAKADPAPVRCCRSADDGEGSCGYWWRAVAVSLADIS